MSRPALVACAVLLALLPAVSAAAREPDAGELRASAEAGDPAAMNELGGSLVASGDQSKLAEARDWFRRSAEKGDTEGMNNYASMLQLGVGGSADEVQAARLVEAAAAKGSVSAHLTLAERYLAGAQGYVHDPAEAYRLLVRASEAGGVNAMISRAVMLATGEGVAEDDQAARHWYQRAAESGEVGFADGLRGLGYMLLNGEGGPPDLVRGVAYLKVAQAAEDSSATTILGEWSERITPEIDRKARAIAKQWIAEHMIPD